MTRQTPVIETLNHIVPLLGLAGEVGELVSEYKKHLRDGASHQLYKEKVQEELGDILWYLADAADSFDLELDQVAEKNLAKCKERWGRSNGEERSHFDAAFPAHERFPRTMDVLFIPLVHDGHYKVQMLTDGVPMGDPLTDNTYEEDGYRFHDVFHLTCMAKLGWSPVIRELKNLKRRSDPKVKEVQDGGRAQVIEEGISALAFAYAQEHGFLENVRAVDYNLLRTIKGMTKHLEVSACTPSEWESVLICAYNVWRELKRQDGGTVHLDLYSRTIDLQQT